MFLFKDQNEIEISITCKICLQEIKFKVSAEEYKKTEKFPIKKKNIHGTPEHRLIVYINRNLEIENFKIEDVREKEEEVSYSEELTRQVLSNIDLSDDEIELYFRTTGRGAISLGEMALLSKKTKEECKKIADRFVEKGLFKEIIGAKPHYTALPPYAALVGQLQDFHKYIGDIRTNAPAQLFESFTKLESQAEGITQLKEYTNFILDLKQNTLSQLFNQKQDFENIATAITQIGEISNVITDLESNTKNVMDNQIADMTTQFKDISTKISSSMQHQIEDLTEQYGDISTEISKTIKSQVTELPAQLENIKAKISKNLEKLRLGVLQQAVDQIVEISFSDWIKNITESLSQQLSTIEKISKDGIVKTKIGLNRQINEIQKLHKEGLEKTTEMFHTQIISKLKEVIDNTVRNIDSITSSTVKSGEDVKEIFVDISKKFGQAITMAEEKLGGISENVLESFGNLRETFTKRIMQTLNNVLDDILKRLEISEKATIEFWEKAKGGAMFTMKDIWFIRSIEGAKAHINDEISKAKMRILIVAPQITDINIDIIKACRTHVNIRIATLIDLTNLEHKSILEKLDKLQNVTCRNRRLQNLFGINRDYEEVVLCVLSKTQIGADIITEIAGIGSIIQEHIKIFVPILEDAWMGAQKDIFIGSRTSYVKEQLQKPSIPEPLKEPVEKPSIPEPLKEPVEKPSIPEPLKEPVEKPSNQIPQIAIPLPSEPQVTPVTIPEEILKLEQVISEPKVPSQPEPSQIPTLEKSIVESIKKPISEGAQKPILDKDSFLATQFDTLLNDIKKLTGEEIASKLNDIRNDITESRGYSGVLKPISLTMSTIRFNTNKLGDTEIKQLTHKIDFWRKKLNL
jgi:hypothetical protein